MKKHLLRQTVRLISLATATSTCLLFPIASAQAATRIQFASDSYCGSYSGDFSGGREFVLNLGSGQTFTTQNVGGGVQYAVYVSGPSGAIAGEQVASDQINYYIPQAGDYYIYVESTTSYNAIEFCAY